MCILYAIQTATKEFKIHFIAGYTVEIQHYIRWSFINHAPHLLRWLIQHNYAQLNEVMFLVIVFVVVLLVQFQNMGISIALYVTKHVLVIIVMYTIMHLFWGSGIDKSN